jgi:hypothetical protein
MHSKDFVEALQGGMKLVDTFAPIAQGLGVPFVSKVSDAAEAIAGIAQNVLERVAEERVVLEPEDVEAIRDIANRATNRHERLAQVVFHGSTTT